MRSPERIRTITVDGAPLTVKWDFEPADEPLNYQFGTINYPAECWVDAVQLGGKWFDASETFAPEFCEQMNDTLLAELEAE